MKCKLNYYKTAHCQLKYVMIKTQSHTNKGTEFEENMHQNNKDATNQNSQPEAESASQIMFHFV